MDGGLMDVLNDVIRDALFEVIGDLLRTENFKVKIEPGSKKGLKFQNPKNLNQLYKKKF